MFSLILVIQKSTQTRIKILGRLPHTDQWVPVDESEDEDEQEEVPGVVSPLCPSGSCTGIIGFVLMQLDGGKDKREFEFCEYRPAQGTTSTGELKSFSQNRTIHVRHDCKLVTSRADCISSSYTDITSPTPPISPDESPQRPSFCIWATWTRLMHREFHFTTPQPQSS